MSTNKKKEDPKKKEETKKKEEPKKKEETKKKDEPEAQTPVTTFDKAAGKKDKLTAANAYQLVIKEEKTKLHPTGGIIVKRAYECKECGLNFETLGQQRLHFDKNRTHELVHERKVAAGKKSESRSTVIKDDCQTAMKPVSEPIDAGCATDKSVPFVAVKVVTCKKCNYTSEKQSSGCMIKGHLIKRHTAKKRFFKCISCKEGFETLEEILPSKCTNCGSNKISRVGKDDVSAAGAPGDNCVTSVKPVSEPNEARCVTAYKPITATAIKSDSEGGECSLTAPVSKLSVAPSAMTAVPNTGNLDLASIPTKK